MKRRMDFEGILATVKRSNLRPGERSMAMNLVDRACRFEGFLADLHTPVWRPNRCGAVRSSAEQKAVSAFS